MDSDILFVIGATGDEPRRSMWLLHPWNGDVHVRSSAIPSAPVSGPDGESIGRWGIFDHRSIIRIQSYHTSNAFTR